MVYQAEHDAEAFKTALAKVKSEADSELRRRTAALAASHAAAAEAAAAQIESLANEMERSEMRVAALAKELERFGIEREAAEREAETEHRAELASRLEEQAEAHALAIAECLVRERVARAEALDEIRLKLNGVKEAYDVNGKSLQKSHAGVKMSLAVFALQSKVANGDPFHEELSAVAAVASDAMAVDDPAGRELVHAVVGSIPEAVAKSGVPTAGRPRAARQDVRRAARRLSLVPETGGGIVAHLVAYLASWLRMSEPTSGWGGGGGAQLAGASRLRWRRLGRTSRRDASTSPPRRWRRGRKGRPRRGPWRGGWRTRGRGRGWRWRCRCCAVTPRRRRRASRERRLVLVCV